MNAEQALKELYALFTLFRQVGISADDIFFASDCLGVSLQRTIGIGVVQGENRFLVTLDTCTEDAKVVELWPEFAVSIGSMSQAELKAMWDAATLAPNHIIAIVSGLRRKGFDVALPVGGGEPGEGN